MRAGKWFLMILIGFCGFVVAADEEASTLVGPQAAKVGIETCADQWEHIGRFVEKGTEHTGSQIHFDKENPDQRLAHMVVEEAFSDRSVISLITAVPTAAGTCDAALSRVHVLNKSCFQVATEIGVTTSANSLGRRSVFIEGNLTHYLLPVGEQCLLINYETIRSN